MSTAVQHQKPDVRRDHTHRDVSGGWLRPTVFGAMDGLVTNVSLIAGVGGGGLDPSRIVLTGLAGLVAGAFSMATGEYTSVASQHELVRADAEITAHLDETALAEVFDLNATITHLDTTFDRVRRLVPKEEPVHV